MGICKRKNFAADFELPVKLDSKKEKNSISSPSEKDTILTEEQKSSKKPKELSSLVDHLSKNFSPVAGETNKRKSTARGKDFAPDFESPIKFDSEKENYTYDLSD